MEIQGGRIRRDLFLAVMPKAAAACDEVCARLGTVLAGPARQAVVAEAATAPDLSRALLRLRERMHGNVWPSGAQSIHLDALVRDLDRRTRADGFHALHDWDGQADHVSADTIPIDVLNYLARKRGAEPTDTVALAILLDYYFLHLLALLSLRIWDAADVGASLDRLQRLLDDLQGPNGSGQRFADDAETLVLVATCHFEPEERGYQALLERVRGLGERHRAAVALGHAASLGCHLRFGFEATYAGSETAMRNDNVADYPWLCFAMATLTAEYARERESDTVGADGDRTVEAILNGLSPDPSAFLDADPPAPLVAHAEERAAIRERLLDHRQDLLARFDSLRPLDAGYSPLAFFFNFSHNVIKGTVVDALLWGHPWDVSLNGLLTHLPVEGRAPASKRALATRLMRYAQASPDRIRGRLMPVIVYDPTVGRRAFARTLRALKAA
jgi:hypothetical protein